MLLCRRALVTRMARLARRPVARNQDVYGTLAGAQRHHNAAIRPNRHEAGRSNQLDGKDKQSQRRKHGSPALGMSDRPQHWGALAVGRAAVIRADCPIQIKLDVNVNYSYFAAMDQRTSIAGIELPDHKDRQSYTITDLSEEFGVTARALRFYEDEGLIAPERHGLARIYSRRDRARLAWILRGKRVGFSLADIREMIDLYDADEEHEEQRRVTVAKCRARIDLLTRQKADIDAAIAELSDFVRVIAQS